MAGSAAAPLAIMKYCHRTLLHGCKGPLLDYLVQCVDKTRAGPEDSGASQMMRGRRHLGRSPMQRENEMLRTMQLALRTTAVAAVVGAIAWWGGSAHADPFFKEPLK